MTFGVYHIMVMVWKKDKKLLASLIKIYVTIAKQIVGFIN